MFDIRSWSLGACVAVAGTILSDSTVFAQANLPLASAGEQVTIKREACRIVEPQKYRVPLSLEASKTITLVAANDGTVKQIAEKANTKVQYQGDIVRFDNALQKLNFQKAQTLVKIATSELKLAEGESAKEVAQVKLEVAEIDAKLAKAALDQTSITMPFAGEVQRILVTEGQFVRAGEPIAIVADNKTMKVEIPSERAAAEAGKSLPIKIEQEDVDAKIDSVYPLSSKFEPLRELFDSIASVVVTVDNPSGRLKAGQTVYVPLIPRQPVVEVANSAVSNTADGGRKVQVVRQLVVRDIPVKLMGQIGSARIFVSGPFSEGDEVVYESSHQLGDGFQLKPSAVAASSPASGTPAQTPTTAPAGSPAKSAGF